MADSERKIANPQREQAPKEQAAPRIEIGREPRPPDELSVDPKFEDSTKARRWTRTRKMDGNEDHQALASARAKGFTKVEGHPAHYDLELQETSLAHAEDLRKAAARKADQMKDRINPAHYDAQHQRMTGVPAPKATCIIRRGGVPTLANVAQATRRTFDMGAR